jgi:hypothetical protein
MELDDIEIARRINAALAYASFAKNTREVREGLQETLSVSTRTLDRMLGKGTNGAEQLRHVHWDDLTKIADYCQLPPEFFSADLARLHEIVPAGGTMVVRPTPIEERELPVPRVKVPPTPDERQRTPQTPPPARKEESGRGRGEGGRRKPASSRRSR